MNDHNFIIYINHNIIKYKHKIKFCHTFYYYQMRNILRNLLLFWPKHFERRDIILKVSFNVNIHFFYILKLQNLLNLIQPTNIMKS